MKRYLFFASMMLAAVSPALAQDTTHVPTGVELIGRYNVSKRPLVAVRPVSGAQAQTVAQQVTSILQRDLQYSDRFEMGAVPQQLATGPVDYRAWNSLNVWYLVAATLTPSAAGFQLRAELHDIVYGKLKAVVTQDLPAAGAANFRLSVHAVSDELVRAISGQPGIAASRVVFTRRVSGGYELDIIDYDGENQQRVMGAAEMMYSPTWSPDGGKLAYGIRMPSAKVELRERDLNTGRERTISGRPQMSYAPAYSPDGKRLAFTLSVGDIAQEVDDYDLERGCCLRRLSHGPRDDLSPSYSPDGSMIAFNSSRLGQPHIYVMPANGGEATLISPYNYGEQSYYSGPEWSPTSDEIAFTGMSRGEYQIMIARASRPGVAQQITSSGRNEDPSWAPDGRHIVFTGVGREGPGLYVIDTQTGTIRKMVSGSRLQMADWSPTLMRSAAATTGN
jgi:TolB protein